MFSNNLTYLLELSGIKKIFLAKNIGVSDVTVSLWLGGRIPQRKYLLALSAFFAKALNVPIELFEHGEALVSKNVIEIINRHKKSIEEILSSPSIVREQSAPYPNTTWSEELTPNEKYIIIRFREAVNLSRSIPLSPAATNEIIECMGLLQFPSELSRHLMSAIRSARRMNEAGGVEPGGTGINPADKNLPDTGGDLD
jgi:transcriptional regulator with XRE-family HTH domain